MPSNQIKLKEDENMKTFILDGRMYTVVREVIGGVMAKEQKTGETLFVSNNELKNAKGEN